MAIIDVNDIDKNLNNVCKKISEHERYLEEYSADGIYEEAEEEKDDDQLAEEARMENIGYEQEVLFELNKKKRRLVRLKEQKKEGDEYISLYSEGYNNEIRRQKDYEVVDLLYRKNEAKKMRIKIENGEIKTAGVFGDWGTGKSTFLGFVKDELEDSGIETIKIDASEYSDQEKIWAYVYSKIREKFIRSFRRKYKFFFSRLKKYWISVLINVILIISVIGFIVYPTTRNFIEYYIKNTENKIVLMLMDTTIVFVYICLFCKYVFPKILELNIGFKNVRGLFIKKFAAPNQDDILGYKVEVKKNLDDMLDIWNKKIVLLIDEIDRCNDNVVIHFFDTVQLFQHSERIQIIYAVDRKSVNRALENKGIPREDVQNYLKKYIDYRINLHPINKESNVLEKIIKQYNFTKNELIFIHTFIRKHLQVNITIRDLKDMLNILCEVKKEWLTEYIFTKKYEDDSNYVVSFKKFIPWAIYTLTDSKWVVDILEDIPAKTEIIQNDDIEKMFGNSISNELKEKYTNCPQYFKESRIMDILCYKELLEKYKSM